MLIPARLNLLECLVGVASSAGACGISQANGGKLMISANGPRVVKCQEEVGGFGKASESAVRGTCPLQWLCLSAACSGHQRRRTCAVPLSRSVEVRIDRNSSLAIGRCLGLSREGQGVETKENSSWGIGREVGDCGGCSVQRSVALELEGKGPPAQ